MVKSVECLRWHSGMTAIRWLKEHLEKVCLCVWLRVKLCGIVCGDLTSGCAGADVCCEEAEEPMMSGSLTGKMARGLATGGTHDKELQWGYLSAHHSHNKVLEDAFNRHQRALIEIAENKARESQEVGGWLWLCSVPVLFPCARFVQGFHIFLLVFCWYACRWVVCLLAHLSLQTEEAMWQQELENRRRRRLAQQQKRELQEYIKKQIVEQKERQRVERESWKSLAPLPRTDAVLSMFCCVSFHGVWRRPLALTVAVVLWLRPFTARPKYGTAEQLERTKDFNSHLDTNLVPTEGGTSKEVGECRLAL